MKSSMIQFISLLGLMLVLSPCKLAVISLLDPETGKAQLAEEAQKAFSAESHVADRWELLCKAAQLTCLHYVQNSLPIVSIRKRWTTTRLWSI